MLHENGQKYIGNPELKLRKAVDMRETTMGVTHVEMIVHMHQES